MRTGDFTNGAHSQYEAEIKVGASRVPTGKINTMSLICEYGSLKDEVHRLRAWKDTSSLAEVNQRHSKSTDLAARKSLLDGQGHVFCEFKVLHAANAFQAFKGHDADFYVSINLASGQCSLALRRKCSVVTIEGLEGRPCREWVGDSTSGAHPAVLSFSGAIPRNRQSKNKK